MSRNGVKSSQLQELADLINSTVQLDGHPRFTFQDENGQERRPDPLLDVIGGGAYGMVLKAYDNKWHRHVAIKHIDWKTIEREVRRVIREVQVLRHLWHPNLVHLVTMFSCNLPKEPPSPIHPEITPFCVFLVCELMDSPLSQLIKDHATIWRESGGRRGQYAIEHAIWLIHQMLHGLHAMHSANIVHRDIKPYNLLVNPSDTTLRICDFGLSRTSHPSPNISHYVVTRFYRAPEIIFGTSTLDPAIDIWAAGCVAAELLIGEPLFAIDSNHENGQYSGQKASRGLLKILKRLGRPSSEDISEVPHPNVKSFLSKIVPMHLEKDNVDRDLKQFILQHACIGPLHDPDNPTVQEDHQQKLQQTVDLIDSMLQFNPRKRPTALECLRFPVFAHFHNEEFIQGCPPFDIPDPMDTNDFSSHNALKQLRSEVDRPLPERPWWEEESAEEVLEDIGDEALQQFIETTYNKEHPSQALWDAVLKGESKGYLIRALSNLGIPPSQVGDLPPDWLPQLAYQIIYELNQQQDMQDDTAIPPPQTSSAAPQNEMEQQWLQQLLQREQEHLLPHHQQISSENSSDLHDPSADPVASAEAFFKHLTHATPTSGLFPCPITRENADQYKALVWEKIREVGKNNTSLADTMTKHFRALLRRPNLAVGVPTSRVDWSMGEDLMDSEGEMDGGWNLET